MNGVCRFGDNCFNSHDRTSRPSTICKYYLLGTCTYGDRCFYDHIRPKTDETTTTTTTNAHLVTRMLNKPKLITHLNNNNDNNNNETNNNNNKEVAPVTSYYEALTGNKQENNNDNNNSSELNIFDENYLQQLNLNKQEHNSDELCPIYEKTLNCPYTTCPYLHGNLCDLCNQASLHPFDKTKSDLHRQECMQLIEKDMEEAFAAQRSAEKVCGICMEKVWEKDKEIDQRFGILENCNHIFCLSCIRKWRASKSYENKIVKACPECRVKSDFITPSKYWFEDDENKRKIIQEYKNNLGQTACKYFKQGDGTCPFGNKCFYLHRYRDGRLAELPAPVKRHRLNRDGNLEAFSNIVRIDFDFSDDDEDDFDILEFFRHSILWDTETDSDYSDMFELSDEFLI